MKVTITTLTDIILTLDVSPDMELDNFKALCECEAGIPSQEIVVMHEGLPLLDDKKDLKTYGIKEGDVLLLQQFLPQRLPLEGALSPLGIDFSTIRLPATGSQDSQGAQSTSQTGKEDDPEYIGEMLLGNPEHLSLLKQNNPKLAEALLSGNKEKFSKILKKQLKEKADKERKRIHMMNADPFDPEAQRLIAEEIRQDNVDSNMEAAMEHHPESFGQVIMLYINCRVNGHPVKAFIDSGAQTTIMSQACAERCSIMRLVDRRWAGIAKGVGTQKIIGRVHLGQIQIEDVFLTSSFSILEDQPMDMLLGLDMLKRHQCCIDLKRNILVIGTTGTETPFLHEGELPLDGIHNIRDFPMPCEDDEKEEAMKLLEARYRSVVDASRADQASNAAALNSGSDAGFPSGSGDSKSGCSSAHSQETIALGDSFTEANVQNLVNLGFSRQQVIEELRRCNGDTNQAMAALFAKSLQLP